MLCSLDYRRGGLMNSKRLIVWLFSFFIISAVSVMAQSVCLKIADVNHINDFAFDGDYLWIATDNGALRFNTTDSSYLQLTTADGLLDNIIMSVYVDSTGDVWFGTYEGISRYDGSSFTGYTESTENGPVTNFISDIVEDKNGAMWFGTVGMGVLKFDGSSWTQYSTSLSSAYVNSLAVGRDGTIWIATLQGVTRYNGVSFTKYTVLGGNAEDNVQAVAVDSEGVGWFGTYGGGVTNFDGADWSTFTTDNGLTNQYVNAVLSDSQDVIWVGTVGEGLLSYDGHTWRSYTDVEGVPLVNIRAIAADRRNVKWIGMSDGSIVRFDLNRPEPPTGLTASHTGPGEDLAVTLEWGLSPEDDLLTGYVVYRSRKSRLSNPREFSSFESLDDVWNAELTQAVILGTVPSGETRFVDMYGLRGGADYFYWVSGIIEDHMESEYLSFSLSTPLTVAAEEKAEPLEFSLRGSYPNPFNPTTTIEFVLPEAGPAVLEIYNMAGQKIRILVSQSMAPGVHTVSWDGKDGNGSPVSSGLYIASLRAGQYAAAHKMLLLR